MQFLDVISVNVWAILASLANLLLLTWIIKRFLFKPVKKMMDARRAAIDEDYAQAKAAREEAEESRLNYEAAMAAAKQTGDQIIADANRTAEYRSNEIVAQARDKASEIRRQAEQDALLEREALFELAVQGNVTEETSEGLETVISALMQTPEYKAMLASPAIGKEERLNALDSAFRGKIPDILLAILRMMISRGQIASLNGMARNYEELARGYRGESVALVTSAVELTEAQAVALRAKLEKKLERKVTLQFQVNPELIGGIRVEVDGRVIDGSIRNKLDEIKEVMNA